MNEELLNLTRALKLKRVPEVLERELNTATKQGMSYADFLIRLLREEYQHTQLRSLEHRIEKAELPDRNWVLENFPFDRQPAVKQAAIRQLAELNFMANAENIVFVGPAGVGKSSLACSILVKALINGNRGLFIPAQTLFDDMYACLADRSSRSLLNRLMKIDLLVIDEMGYLNLNPSQTNIFFKLMEERYSKKSTIITTNLDYEAWYEFLGKKTMVEALLDRLLHKCHTIKIDGQTLRTPLHPQVLKKKGK